MIEMQDKRKFLTHEENFTNLLEFSDIFNAQISIVNANDDDILDLVTLANAISNKNYKPKHEIELVEIKKPKKYRKHR